MTSETPIEKKKTLTYQIEIHLRTYLREACDKFPDFFCMGTFIDSTHMKL